jgi:hypothetical protein
MVDGHNEIPSYPQVVVESSTLGIMEEASVPKRSGYSRRGSGRYVPDTTFGRAPDEWLLGATLTSTR